MAWFTGGLFDDDSALPLNRDGVETALKAVVLDWSEIDPSILGRLLAEWESEKATIAAAPERAEAARMRQRRQLACCVPFPKVAAVHGVRPGLWC